VDVLALLRRASEAGLRVEPAGNNLVVRGPRSAEPVVKLLAENKVEVLAALVPNIHEAELVAPAPWFNRVILQAESEPGLSMPCTSRRGRVAVLPSGLFSHFCTECGAWGAFGYGVNLRAGRMGRWYCAAHKPPQGAVP
jgi:hypothetical protein